MLDIYNVSVLDILPPNLKQDPDIIAASKAIDSEFLLVVNAAKECILLPRLDDLEGDVLDLLAWEAHVDYYDSTLSDIIKKQLVRNSTRWHKLKGTPAAVEELIGTVFGDGEVIEWFDYGGEPGMFKVLTNNSAVTGELAQQFIRVLEAAKRKSSHLEEIIIALSGEMNLYYAGVVHIGDFLEIRQVV